MFRPVRVHAREQNFSGAEIGHNLGPLYGIPVGALTAAMRVHLGVAAILTSCIDCHDDALAAKTFRSLLHQSGIVHSRSIERYFVRPRTQNVLNVADVPQAAADG